jgi:hypothetical protein
MELKDGTTWPFSEFLAFINTGPIELQVSERSNQVDPERLPGSPVTRPSRGVKTTGRLMPAELAGDRESNSRGTPLMINTVAFAISVAVALAFGEIVRRADAPLRRAGYDVVALELARSPEQSATILERYRAEPDGLSALRQGLWLDSVLFIPAYTVSLALGCRLAAGVFRSSSVGATVGEVLQFWAVFAAAFDYFENCGLYRQAASGASLFWWRWTFASSLAKWLIIVAALVYGVVALGVFLVGLFQGLSGQCRA